MQTLTGEDLFGLKIQKIAEPEILFSISKTHFLKHILNSSWNSYLYTLLSLRDVELHSVFRLHQKYSKDYQRQLAYIFNQWHTAYGN